ncbi:MAG: hypothetical protein F6K47_03135, partial [Symploca sp. SIO2E6]|nr:hypothetical protein [Symploca sp. SIO2E6]
VVGDWTAEAGGRRQEAESSPDEKISQTEIEAWLVSHLARNLNVRIVG